jgi:hypothetical protein
MISNDNITLITGFWHIKENTKHSIQHYYKYFKKTFDKISGFNIVFFYKDDDILKYIKSINKSKHIIYKKLDVYNLPTYKYSNDYLNSCKNQPICKSNNLNEKGCIHYKRELKESGENSFKSVFSIWTSKIFLVDSVIDENPFNTKYFTWIDASFSRINDDKLIDLTHYISDDFLYTRSKSGMNYKDKQVKTPCVLLCACKDMWIKIKQLYLEKLNYLRNSNYCHDEETILTEIYNSNPSLFTYFEDINVEEFENKYTSTDNYLVENNTNLKINLIFIIAIGAVLLCIKIPIPKIIILFISLIGLYVIFPNNQEFFRNNIPVVFLHIPKNAGTKIKQIYPEFSGKSHCDSYPKPNEINVAVIRNPATRLQSTFSHIKYRNSIKNNANDLVNFKTLDDLATAYYSKNHKYHKDAVNIFNWDESSLEKYKKTSDCSKDTPCIHWMPQYLYVDNHNSVVNYFIRFEHLDEDILTLQKKRIFRFSNITNTKINKSSNKYKKLTKLTQNCYKLLNDVYKKDYLLWKQVNKTFT